MPRRHEIILCSTPRSGSTLLADEMLATGMLGFPGEFFNDDKNNKGDTRQTIMERNWSQLGATGFIDYCDRLHRHYGSENGVHSVKMHFQQFKGALRQGYFRRDVSQSFVWVRRVDKAAQAASLAIAIKTQKWNSRMTTGAEVEVEVPDDLLARCYRSVIYDDVNWAAHFALFGIAPLDLTYDDIVADRPGCLRRIAVGAGIDLAERTTQADSHRPGLQKQSGDLNRRLIARLADMRIEAFGPGNILHDTGVLFP